MKGTAFVLADWQVPAPTAAPAIIPDAPLVFRHQPAPYTSSAALHSTAVNTASSTHSHYVPQGTNKLPDAVPAVFMGSGFVVQDPQWCEMESGCCCLTWCCLDPTLPSLTDIDSNINEVGYSRTRANPIPPPSRMLHPVEQYLASPTNVQQHTTLISFITHMYVVHSSYASTRVQNPMPRHSMHIHAHVVDPAHPSSTRRGVKVMHNIMHRDQGVASMLLNDADGRIRVFLRHQDAVQVGGMCSLTDAH